MVAIGKGTLGTIQLDHFVYKMALQSCLNCPARSLSARFVFYYSTPPYITILQKVIRALTLVSRVVLCLVRKDKVTSN